MTPLSKVHLVGGRRSRVRVCGDEGLEAAVLLRLVLGGWGGGWGEVVGGDGDSGGGGGRGGKGRGGGGERTRKLLTTSWSRRAWWRLVGILLACNKVK